MRKFRARWWVADPLARYHATLDALEGDIGIRIRRSATPEEVRWWALWTAAFQYGLEYERIDGRDRDSIQ